MQSEKNYFRVVFVILSLISVSIILWNTYIFFNELKENERIKMEVLSAAYAEILGDDDLEASVADLAFACYYA